MITSRDIRKQEIPKAGYGVDRSAGSWKGKGKDVWAGELFSTFLL